MHSLLSIKASKSVWVDISEQLAVDIVQEVSESLPQKAITRLLLDLHLSALCCRLHDGQLKMEGHDTFDVSEIFTFFAGGTSAGHRPNGRHDQASPTCKQSVEGAFKASRA
jgi:hypothetical protein